MPASSPAEAPGWQAEVTNTRTCFPPTRPQKLKYLDGEEKGEHPALPWETLSRQHLHRPWDGSWEQSNQKKKKKN